MNHKIELNIEEPEYCLIECCKKMLEFISSCRGHSFSSFNYADRVNERFVWKISPEIDSLISKVKGLIEEEAIKAVEVKK